MNALQITIPSIFGLAAIVMCFFRKLPACLTAYVALVSAALLGVINLALDQYLIWGFIALADTVNIYATRMDAPGGMRLYTTTGCVAGTAVGAVAGSLAAIIGAGALGAILGFLAYTQTPEGKAMGLPMSHKLSLLAGTGCTVWFTMIMVAMVTISFF